MGQKVAAKRMPEGIMVSHPLVDTWGEAPDLEIEQVGEALVIRPKVNHTRRLYDEIVNDMKTSGLVEELPWPQPPVVSLEERERLAGKLDHGHPLSQLILEERDESA
jgi:hypothetical protein